MVPRETIWIYGWTTFGAQRDEQSDYRSQRDGFETKGHTPNRSTCPCPVSSGSQEPQHWRTGCVPASIRRLREQMLGQ